MFVLPMRLRGTHLELILFKVTNAVTTRFLISLSPSPPSTPSSPQFGASRLDQVTDAIIAHTRNNFAALAVNANPRKLENHEVERIGLARGEGFIVCVDILPFLWYTTSREKKSSWEGYR